MNTYHVEGNPHRKHYLDPHPLFSGCDPKVYAEDARWRKGIEKVTA
jgi:hypothetical protein